MNLKQSRQWCASAHANQRYGNTVTDDGGMDGDRPYTYHLRKTEQVALRFGFRRAFSIRKACWCDTTSWRTLAKPSLTYSQPDFPSMK